MPIRVRPDVDELALAALERGLAAAGVRLDGDGRAPASAWLRTARREAVEKEPAPVRYARSPRSTRGATRA